MARKISLLVVVLVAILSLSLALVACGESETPATTDGTTTNKAPITTTTPDVTTPTPVTTPKTPDGSTGTPNTNTETPNTPPPPGPGPDEYLGPNEEWIETVLFDGQWVTPHEEYRLGPGKGNNGEDYEYMWYFSFKSEGNHFGTTPEDHPTSPSTPGIQLVNEPYALFIKDINDTDADYTKYEITYWATAQWYQIYCVADGFVPVDGTEYDLYLVFVTPEDTELEDGTIISNGSNYPGEYHYIWDLGEPWTYKAPQKSESKYLAQEQLDTIVGDSFWLLENEPTTVDATGKVTVKFKSDGNPFDNTADTPGVHYTIFGKLYINGEEYQIVESSYVPEEWYILHFQVKDFTPVAGESYEIIFTITANDPTGVYCAYDSYYVLAAEVPFAG